MTEELKGRLKTVEEVLDFILAGNARFTLRSVKTGTRYTYRIQESKDKRVSFVALLTGTDNEAHYSYMGVIEQDEGRKRFRTTAKSRVSEDAEAYKAFVWVWEKLIRELLPDTLEVWHEGHCGRCGRTLTVPESVARGIGPECYKMTGAKGEDKVAGVLGEEPELEFTHEA